MNAIANGILERAPAHLQTAHCSLNDSAIDCYDQPWLDLTSTHSDCTDSLDAAHNEYQHGPAQLFFYIEGRYENEGASLGCLIDQAVWAVVGGGSGQVFGNNPIWLFDSNWEDALDSAGSVAMGHLVDLFESRAWWLLKPDLDHDVLLSDGAGTAAARVAGGETLIIYTPSARTLKVDLSELTFLAENGRAWWFDPVDGSTQDLGTFPATGVHELPGARARRARDRRRRRPSRRSWRRAVLAAAQLSNAWTKRMFSRARPSWTIEMPPLRTIHSRR